MRFIILALALALVAPAVFAADPECTDPDVYDEATDGQYDATGAVRFCTPEMDADDIPLVDGDLTRCTVAMAGQAFAITSSNRPGQYVAFTTPSAVKQAHRTGPIEVFCETEAGAGAPAVASNARFRDAGAAGIPTLLK